MRGAGVRAHERRHTVHACPPWRIPQRRIPEFPPGSDPTAPSQHRGQMPENAQKSEFLTEGNEVNEKRKERARGKLIMGVAILDRRAQGLPLRPLRPLRENLPVFRARPREKGGKSLTPRTPPPSPRSCGAIKRPQRGTGKPRKS